MVSRTLPIIAALLGVAACSTLTLLEPLPAGVTPQKGATTLKTSLFPQLQSSLLGLSAAPTGSPVSVGLLNAPQALIYVQQSDIAEPRTVKGVQVELPGGENKKWLENLKAQSDAIHEAYTVVSVENGKISGDEAFTKAAGTPVDTSRLKSKGAVFNELEAALQVAAAIQQNGDKLKKQSGPSVFFVSLPSDAAPADVDYVLKELSSAARKVFGDDGVVTEFAQFEPASSRAKRADADTDQPPIVLARQSLNVSVFSSTDYPAIFAIFAGLVIAIGLALLYISVGLWTMDPGRDSIIYRMTTVRQKKD